MLFMLNFSDFFSLGSFFIFQLIVGADGVCGWNYEHTLIEGPPLFRMMEYIVKQSSPNSTTHRASTPNQGAKIGRHATDVTAKPMPFELDASMVAFIDAAKDHMDT